jgi:hypothetical protein
MSTSRSSCARALRKLKNTSKIVEEIASQRRSKDRAAFWTEYVRKLDPSMCLFVDEVCNDKKQRKRGRGFRGGISTYAT